MNSVEKVVEKLWISLWIWCENLVNSFCSFIKILYFWWNLVVFRTFFHPLFSGFSTLIFSSFLDKRRVISTFST